MASRIESAKQIVNAIRQQASRSKTELKGPILSGRNLRSSKKPPFVWAIRNKQSGQVLYTQTRSINEGIINWQIPNPNKENKRPKYTRRDLYTPLACIELTSYHHQIQVLDALVRLKLSRNQYMKENILKTRDWRFKDYNGNIWSNVHFRPTYIHEAVSDIQTTLEALERSLDDEARVGFKNDNQDEIVIVRKEENQLQEDGIAMAEILWDNEWYHGKWRENEFIKHGKLPEIDRGINTESLIKLEENAFAKWLKRSAKTGIAV